MSHSNIHKLLRTDEFHIGHLFNLMLYTSVSAVIAYLLGNSIEKIFELENNLPLTEESEPLKNRFSHISTLRLTINILLQCLLISVSMFAIHKGTSLIFYFLGMTRTAFIESSGSRATFAASNVIIVIVFVHTIKTFNQRLLEVLERLKKGI